MSTNIDGKVVVLTGGSAGLGEDAARYLAARRAAVVLCHITGPLKELLRVRIFKELRMTVGILGISTGIRTRKLLLQTSIRKIQ